MRWASGANKATFKASPSKCAINCNAAVTSSHPFEHIIASSTSRYWSQLDPPAYRGTGVEVNRGRFGVTTGFSDRLTRKYRDSAFDSSKSFCNLSTLCWSVGLSNRNPSRSRSSNDPCIGSNLRTCHLGAIPVWPPVSHFPRQYCPGPLTWIIYVCVGHPTAFFPHYQVHRYTVSAAYRRPRGVSVPLAGEV